MNSNAASPTLETHQTLENNRADRNICGLSPRFTARRTVRVAAIFVASLFVIIPLARQATKPTPSGPWLDRQIARYFGPPAVVMGQAAEKADDNKVPTGPDFDHSAFDALLRKHVDAAGMINYAALKQEQAPLDEYIIRIKSANLDTMSKDQRLALLINAYNAFTLRLIIDHYPIKSIKDIPEKDRWRAVRWSIDKRVMSLDQLEHEEIRPKYNEPRIHFALVCAAVDCPPLRTGSSTAAKLEH